MEIRERNRALMAAAALLAASAACFFTVDQQTHPAMRQISQWPSMLILREVVTPFGQSQTQLLLLCALWLVGVLVKNRSHGQAAALALMSMAAAGVGAQALKFLAHRPRPDIPAERAGDLSSAYYRSFPSADVASAFAAAMAVGAVFPRSRPWLLAAAAIVGLMRVLKLAHWPSDVLAGAAIGLLGYAAARWLSAKVRMRRVGASPSQGR